MKGSKGSTESRATAPAVRPIRREITFAVLLTVLLGVVLLFKLLKIPSATLPVATPSASALPVPESKSVSLAPAPKPSVAIAPAPAPAIQSVPLTAAQLIAEMTLIGDGGAAITPAQAAKFRKDLAELVRRGVASVPAIQDFLGQFTDTQYADINGGQRLGYASLRLSLIDALRQVGGPVGEAALVQTLQTTADPTELLALAKDLSQIAPGQYDDLIISGAQQTLEMAAAGQLGTNTAVGAAFRTLQTYNGDGTPEDAANKNPQQFDSAVQLANLPNGQGLPALVQMAQNSSGGAQTVATEMIAQLAGQNSDALDTLTQMAQNGQISQSAWVQLAPILAGNQYQIDSSGQNYTVVNGATTPDQIVQHVAIIDSLMASVPPGSAAAKSLQQELNNLGAN